MSQKFAGRPTRVPAKKLVRDIRRATRKHHSAEDKIRIVLEGLRGEESIAALCRREALPGRCERTGPSTASKASTITSGLRSAAAGSGAASTAASARPTTNWRQAGKVGSGMVLSPD